MVREINFDMDGTIANLYAVENWLTYLLNEETYPYENAKPMVNMNILARELNKLRRNGYKVNIISWTSKGGTAEYNARVATAKIKWLKKHLGSVHFDNIAIVPYGTPKNTIGCGILFDDEIGNRNMWGIGAYDVDNILGVLKGLE